jgi:hypothetical protein
MECVTKERGNDEMMKLLAESSLKVSGFSVQSMDYRADTRNLTPDTLYRLSSIKS